MWMKVHSEKLIVADTLKEICRLARNIQFITVFTTCYPMSGKVNSQPKSYFKVNFNIAGFGVLTAVVMKSYIFPDIRPPLHAGFLLGLFHEDRGDMFLRNVG
jgi:hypothetical protein